ncbi:MAG: ribonuclease E/G, partial [Clostridia bacterium]|nr:ribonuclease E/G [Clostridia bacterium]
EESKKAVLQALEDALAKDSAKTVLYGFTSLGLLEMSRKKTGPALHTISPCPHCKGTGLKEEQV